MPGVFEVSTVKRFDPGVTHRAMWTVVALYFLNWLAFVVAVAGGAPLRIWLAALLSLPVLWGGMWFIREVHNDGRWPWERDDDAPSRVSEDDWETV